MSSMITFAANNEFFRKRKRVHKACDSCKKRRKRCIHTFDDDDDHASINPTSTSTEDAPPAEGSSAAGPSRELLPGHHVGHDDGRRVPPSRFIGYLSPEAVMSGHIREPISGEKVGGWVTATDEAEGSTTERDRNGTPPNVTGQDAEESLIKSTLQAYLDAVGVSTVPDAQVVDVLLAVYFEYVNPLLPVVDQKTFYDRKHSGDGSRMLLQAMCLVASRHEGIAHHLYLSNNPNLLAPREFAKRLYAAIVAGLHANLEKDRITVIQVLTLISLYSEGVDGADAASMHLVQAIHHAHTIGLQFGRQQNNEKSEAMEKLFWCLWSLDKINATIHGRPQYMHERDNQLENWTAKPERRRTPFAIWLVLAAILDRVIELYRPGCDPSVTGLEDAFPGFEDIIGEIGDQLKGPIVAALELFYHAVAMASHKSRSITDPVRSTPSSVRQSLSAVRVISILSNEFPSDLPPLPIVPYSLALAMTVAYRQFRRSKLQGHKNRAKEDFKNCCKLLEKLRATWWSAGCMADLGAAALKKADRSTNRRQQESKTASSRNAWKAGTASRPPSSDVGANWASTTLPDPSAPTAVTGSSHHSGAANPNANPSQSAGTSPSVPTLTPVSVPSMLAATPQPAISSERGGGPNTGAPLTSTTASATAAAMPAGTEHTPSTGSLSGEFSNESPDWLNFDNAFENMDTLLGSGGADLSTELLRGLDWDWTLGPGA
ncbi:fungal-specific transcription factor domain-containing protein [Phyllosticta citribraziliensis]|uniref:Fungal-specific transcription factor domain-containing protein n=1 Tax=Phyllosticta citribraziliensis TaxID=989973 RepID=A0ABR1L5V5_9PEZI